MNSSGSEFLIIHSGVYANKNAKVSHLEYPSLGIENSRHQLTVYYCVHNRHHESVFIHMTNVRDSGLIIRYY